MVRGLMTHRLLRLETYKEIRVNGLKTLALMRTTDRIVILSVSATVWGLCLPEAIALAADASSSLHPIARHQASIFPAAFGTFPLPSAVLFPTPFMGHWASLAPFVLFWCSFLALLLYPSFPPTLLPCSCSGWMLASLLVIHTCTSDCLEHFMSAMELVLCFCPSPFSVDTPPRQSFLGLMVAPSSSQSFKWKTTTSL